jgi:ergothioneine biosynthesis protein EgtB
MQINLIEQYQQVRNQSIQLSAPLSSADMCIQSMADASPTRWHLAHTSWFFETVILKNHLTEYTPVNSDYNYLFNSYYNGIGNQFPRAQRGTQTRPSIEEIMDYRKTIDQQMLKLLDGEFSDQVNFLTQLGLHHEQQHQELMLTDIKHAFSLNPTYPQYQPSTEQTQQQAERLSWLSVDESVYQIGHMGSTFCYDNELPMHNAYVYPCKIASRLITNQEYQAFVHDKGYHTATLWLSDGWDWCRNISKHHPLYWLRKDDQWFEFTLNGLQPLQPHQPVTHINYYEAEAFARWAGKRLPTEYEWEVAARQYGAQTGNFVNSGKLHPQISADTQFLGDCWEWTSSSYSAYPGYKPFAGAVGEYNGKFMCNQYVLRGGSCATPEDHIRFSYRNFFYPHQRWQFTGIRLAEDD